MEVINGAIESAPRATGETTAEAALESAAIHIKKYVDESNGDEIAVRVIKRIIKDHTEKKCNDSQTA